VDHADLFGPLLHDLVQVVGLILDFIPCREKLPIRLPDILDKCHPENHKVRDEFQKMADEIVNTVDVGIQGKGQFAEYTHEQRSG
jgi:hypothetical protein